jgi:hypothetical protein
MAATIVGLEVALEDFLPPNLRGQTFVPLLNNRILNVLARCYHPWLVQEINLSIHGRARVQRGRLISISVVQMRNMGGRKPESR